MRMIFHNVNAKISVGVDIADGILKVAFAACHTRDTFAKWKANKCLNARLDMQLVRGGRTRLKYIRHVEGVENLSIGKQVFGPIRDIFRGLDKKRQLDKLPDLIHAALDKSLIGSASTDKADGFGYVKSEALPLQKSVCSGKCNCQASRDDSDGR